MNLTQINFALRDIAETLAIWRDEKPHTDPYMQKLWAEFDTLSARKQALIRRA